MTSVTPEPSAAGALAVAPSRRALRITAYVVSLVGLLAVVGWVSTHPDSLPTSKARVVASTPVAVPVFIGVFDTPADFDRSLHVSGVRVFATSTVDVTITPHVCHGGSINVTTTPDSFCASLGRTEDVALDQGDEIVLEVVGDSPGVVDIDRIRVAYRDGLQWATQDAGAPSQVTILAR
jgi:hypothetical protein